MHPALSVSLLVAVIAGPSIASAHTLPAVLGVGASRDGRPSVVRMSHGLAVWDEVSPGEGTWRFGCPALWDGPETPLALGGVLIARGGAYSISAAAPVLFEGGATASLGSDGVRRLVELDGSVFALGVDGLGSEIWELTMGRARLLHTSTERYDAITADEEVLYTATATGSALEIRTVTAAGATASLHRIPCPECSGATVTVEWAGALYLRLARGASERLLRIDAEAIVPLVETESRLLGPVLNGATPMIAIGGQLHLLDESGAVPIADARSVTCLSREGRAASACVRTEMRSLDPSGATGAPLFEMAEVGPPRLEGLDDVTRQACEIQWLDFSAEAGLQPEAEIDPAPSDELAAGCRCVAAPSSNEEPAFALVVLFGLLLTLLMARLSSLRPRP